MKTKYTPEIVAKTLGCTVEQAKDGLKRSAAGVRALTDADLKRWGKTRKQADAIAADYELRAV